MSQYLYDLIIHPIEYILEAIFDLFNGRLGHPGYAIIGVSLAVSLLTLPLYNRSEQIQEEERQKQQVMERWVTHIRKTFKGDERMMMLSSYYRQNNYHPAYALRSSVSLLLNNPDSMTPPVRCLETAIPEAGNRLIVYGISDISSKAC